MTYSASNIGVTLKSGLGGRSRSLKTVPFDRSHNNEFLFDFHCTTDWPYLVSLSNYNKISVEKRQFFIPPSI